MSLILVGLNHKTAPVEIRERLALTGCMLTRTSDGRVFGRASDASPAMPGIDEHVILSTCNRLEIYASTGDVGQATSIAQDALAEMLDLSSAELDPYLYRSQDGAAVEHLFRVACGIDSMVLGESQILGQVAEAYARAVGSDTIGPVLGQLFTRAVHAGKRARSETPISKHTTSVSHAAVRLARARFGDLRLARVLVVGAGEMAEQAALALYDENARNMTCVSRTYEHAERLARRFDARAVTWGSLAEALAEADVVIAATGAPHTVIYGEDVEAALSRRSPRQLVVVDIAVPRDVAPAVTALPGVLYYDIDDVQAAVDTNRAQREAALPQVETIVRDEARDFCAWLQGRQVVPVLVELRRKADTVVQSEVDLMLRRLDDPDEHTQQVMRLLAHRIVGKLLHEPTVRLKAEAAHGNAAVYADALRELFGLHLPAETPSRSRQRDANDD